MRGPLVPEIPICISDPAAGQLRSSSAGICMMLASDGDVKRSMAVLGASARPPLSQFCHSNGDK